MKIIFLDIDGVLNRIGETNRTTTKWEGCIGMEPELVDRLNELRHFTGAELVLSSTWRLSDNWREAMRKNGIIHEFLDRTPRVNPGIRGDEIALWLWNRPVEKYAILDDDNDFILGQPLFQTDYREGLTPTIARAVAEHLLT